MNKAPALGTADSLASVFDHVSIVAPPRRQRKPTPPPFSLRLSTEERQRLEQDAGRMPLGAYIRTRLFDGTPAKPNRNRYPVKDQAVLARVLAELGQSRIANNLNQMAKAANSGSFLLTAEGEASLRDACNAVKDMRRDLMAALGLDGGGKP